jgi:MFS family permease
MVALVMFTFFVISLLTNIVGPLVPDIIASFHVSLTAAAFLAFSFFIAYAVMSIPAGFLVERLREKPVMILAFLAGTLGALSFALFPAYRVAIVSYFVIGAGMAVLQVAINPLLRVSAGEEHYAFYSALAQFVFGAASFRTADSARVALGFHLLDFCRVNSSDDCCSCPVEISPRAIHHRGEGGVKRHVSWLDKEKGGLDVLYRHACLRGL